MPGRGGQWDDANDRLMLLSIIHLTAQQLPKWDEVAELMDNQFTGNAIRQRFQKLRAESKEKFGEAGGEGKVATPRKRKATATKEGTPGSATGKRKSKHSVEADDVEDADDSEGENKKVKTEKTGEDE